MSFNEYNRTASTPQNFKYTGKEEISEIGWIDYGPRKYDPAVGRFTTIDPLTEFKPNWTPYRYAFNNPVNVIDPTGMIEVEINGEELLGKNKRQFLKSFFKATSNNSSDSDDKDNNGFDDSDQSDVVNNPTITAAPNSGVRGGRFGNTRAEGTQFHDGVDISARKGTTIRSILPGTVIAGTREDLAPGQGSLTQEYGNRVLVRSVDASGNIVILQYAHMDGVDVEIGDTVGSGQALGISGNTGNASGISITRHHVHVQATKNGESVNPENYMKTKFQIYSGNRYPGPSMNVPSWFHIEGSGEM